MLVAVGVLAFGLLVPAAQASVSLIQISSDPFTNSTSQHGTEVEPDIFAHGSTIVAAFQQGRFGDAIGGSSDVGFATSLDGGATWKQGSLPLTTFSGGPFERATDPAVAYDAKTNVWLISTIALDQNGWSVVVDRSTDGGLTWSDPVTVAAPSAQVNLDKPWITCDGTATSAFYGNCYLEWIDYTQNQAGGNVDMSTSSDGGLTWGAVKRPPNATSDNDGQPLVQPDGTVVVPIAVSDTFQLVAFRSTDGGASWSSPVPISNLEEPPLAGGLRGGFSGVSSAGIDRAGKIYVAWQDCTFRPNCSNEKANGGANDIVYSTSTDGLTWSPATRIPIAPVKSAVDAFLPGLGVDRSTSGSHAHLALTYYYYPQANCDYSTCQLDVGFVSSTDGGATWSPPTKLAGPMSLSWLPTSDQGPMVGDYIATTFTSDGLAHGIFAVAKTPTNGNFDEAIYTTTRGLRPASPCVVPKVVGESLARAKATISKHNCRTGTIRRASSRTVRKGLVIAQKPKPGTVLAAGRNVSLLVSRGKPH